MPALKTTKRATRRTAEKSKAEEREAWEPLKPVEPKKVVRKRSFSVHIAGSEDTAQVMEDVTDEGAAIAAYVKKNKLVSHAHNFRVVEVKRKASTTTKRLSEKETAA